MAEARKGTTGVSEPTPSSALDAPDVLEVPAGVFKNTCLALMDDVRDGHTEVVVTKHGTAVARLVRPDADAPSAHGFLRGTVIGEDDIVSPDPEAWGELA